ncbi:uncharacterized protein LOC144425091 [Styela clava]
MEVQWYRNFKLVTNTSQQYGIYQEINGNNSILHIKNAIISDSATYICRTTDSSGIEYNFKVEGNPSITSVTNSSCNQSLIVTWIPNKNAIGFIHRILARNLTTKKEVSWNSSVPTSITPQHTELFGLKASTEYFVTVEACVSESMCDYEYSDNKTANTNGKTAPVISSSLSSNCSIQWVWKNNEKPETVTGLKVTRYCITIATRSNVESSHIDAFNISIPHTISAPPNENCTVSIQVIGCAGLSEAVNAVGYCVGKPAAPNELAKPMITDDATDSNGIRKITVTKPDESNGLLSCLFIIVKDESSERNINFSMENLNMAQSSTTEYIAVALPVYNFTDDKQVIKLGDDSKSSCNVTQIIDAVSKRRRRRRNIAENEIFVGQNRKLDKEKSYSVFVVSTTPCGIEICMKMSPPTQLTKTNGFQSWIIAVIVAGACLFVAVLIMVVVIKRRKAKSGTSEIDSVGDVIPTRPDNVDSASKFQNEEATTGDYAEVGFTATHENTPSTSKFQHKEESTDGYTKMAFAGTEKNDSSIPKSSSKIQTRASTPSEQKTQVNVEGDSGPYANVSAKVQPSKSSDTSISTSDLEEVYNSMRKKENSQFFDQFQGHTKRRKYIATQGPLATTVDDFWQMIIEHKCYLIVMLTKEREAGKKKCEKYWPDENKNQKFGSVLVENVHEVNYGSFIKRSFTVKSRNEGHDVTFNVHQYQFLKWPDHGAPATTSDLLRMHRAVMKSYEEIGKGSPIVVHCSAGAGRTGTLIGFDILLDESRSTRSVDAFACVLNMRKQRVEMVQNSDQYVLVHKLVLEAILFEDRDLSSDEAKAKLEKLKYEKLILFHIIGLGK